MPEPVVLFEDDSVLVINKPAGWVVHAGAGETGETVVDWFVKNHPAVSRFVWEDPTRPGIVHRLDKDTSGVMLIAKNPDALKNLQAQFQARTVTKIYKALTFGEPAEGEGTIETGIGRHPTKRERQMVYELSGGVGERTIRQATTGYQVESAYTYKNQIIAFVTFLPKTGRMHQIRVHAKYLGTPILGDSVYTTKHAHRFNKEEGIERQILHAAQITFTHPTLHAPLTFSAPVPQDMQSLITRFQA